MANAAGFVPVNSITQAGSPVLSAGWEPKIASGYRQNIGMGDFVFINASTGYIGSYNDLANTAGFAAGLAYMGTFWGCEYVQQPNNTGGVIVPAQKPAWIANSVTADGSPAKATVVVSPECIGIMTSTGNPFLQAHVGRSFMVSFTVSGGYVQLQPNGTSTMAVDVGSLGTAATLPVRMIGLVPGTGTTVGNQAYFKMKNIYMSSDSAAPIIPT